MDLREFVNQLRAADRLLTVRRPVDPRFEIGALIKQAADHPILFERVAGHDIPVVANLCASRELVSAALGVAGPPRTLIEHLARAVDGPAAPAVEPAGDTFVELPPDLGQLPILTYFAEDAGPYIASGIVSAADPEHGVNLSFHRALVLDDRHLALRIVERHLHRYIERGLTSFALCIGNPIHVLLAAAISVDLGVSELAVANALLPTPVHELDGHHVPRSELVLLCELTGELADEGPFLDLTETFDIVRRQPVARVERVLARPQPLFHALLPSGEEHKVLMGMPREPSILRAVNEVCQCHDVRVTPGGCCWLHGVVQIRKRADADARAAIDAAFRGHPSMKHVFVVDEDVDIDDPAAIEWALATRFQGDRDLVLRPAQRGSSLDPSAAPETHLTAKLGFDLTIPLATPAEPYRRARPPLTVRLEDYLARGERDADEG